MSDTTYIPLKSIQVGQTVLSRTNPPRKGVVVGRLYREPNQTTALLVDFKKSLGEIPIIEALPLSRLIPNMEG
jgi:hypothetical protein